MTEIVCDVAGGDSLIHEEGTGQSVRPFSPPLGGAPLIPGGEATMTEDLRARMMSLNLPSAAAPGPHPGGTMGEFGWEFG